MVHDASGATENMASLHTMVGWGTVVLKWNRANKSSPGATAVWPGVIRVTQYVTDTAKGSMNTQHCEF